LDAVTVTANSRAQLEDLLGCKQLRSAFDRIIVVDNRSTDGSAEVASRAGATVVSVSERTGYGPCVNLGVRETDGDAFAVLNPDITFDTRGVIERLKPHFRQPQVGLVAPALILPDGRLQDSARHIPTPLDLALRRGVAAERGAIRGSGEVPWVVGACFLARRRAWDAVGGFDERFFLYFEDVDLCWRLRKAGWSTVLESSVRVRHEFAGQSRRSLWAWQTRRHFASAARFYRKNPRFLISRSVPPVSLA
jgi:GT2 family glycosyltransferase